MKFGKKNIKKQFDSEPVYNEKYLKAKIKSDNGKINANFYNNKISILTEKFLLIQIEKTLI